MLQLFHINSTPKHDESQSQAVNPDLSVNEGKELKQVIHLKCVLTFS